MAKPRVTEGTVFAFPLDAGFGCGQILHKYQLVLAAIFRPVFTEPLPIASEIISAPVGLVVTTFDIRIKKGLWRTLGVERPIVVPELVFKLSRSDIGNVTLESYDRTVRRRATPEEERIVPYRSTASEALVERMFRALHGFEPWLPDFEPYRYENILKRSTLLAQMPPN